MHSFRRNVTAHLIYYSVVCTWILYTLGNPQICVTHFMVMVRNWTRNTCKHACAALWVQWVSEGLRNTTVTMRRPSETQLSTPLAVVGDIQTWDWVLSSLPFQCISRYLCYCQTCALPEHLLNTVEPPELLLFSYICLYGTHVIGKQVFSSLLQKALLRQFLPSVLHLHFGSCLWIFWPGP